MKVQILNHLNEKQQKKVQALLDACRDYEPLTLTPPLSAESCFDSSIPCFYLLYENNELISFLSLFLPDQYYGEAMAFTHPMARQRGYFKRLWNEALVRLDDYIEDMELLFVTDGQSPEALAALTAMEGEYQYSEYIMERDMSEPFPETGDGGPALALKQAGDTPESREQCARIHEEIFCDGQSASQAFIQEAFDNPQTGTWLAEQEGQAVGILHLTQWEGGTYLSGFGILPDFQGKGLGKALLHQIPSCLAKRHELLSLQVSSLNETACQLYRTQGFQEQTHRDYYY